MVIGSRTATDSTIRSVLPRAAPAGDGPAETAIPVLPLRSAVATVLFVADWRRQYDFAQVSVTAPGLVAAGDQDDDHLPVQVIIRPDAGHRAPGQ
jgi:hypothetical protein